MDSKLKYLKTLKFCLHIVLLLLLSDDNNNKT